MHSRANKARVAPKSRKSAAKKVQHTQKRRLTTKRASPVARIAPISIAKRYSGGHVERDSQGRELPVDYANHHLHDPYQYFDPVHSKVFDERPHHDACMQYSMEDIEEQRKIVAKWIPEDLEKVRAGITNPKELEAFDAVMVPLFTGDNLYQTKEQYLADLQKQGIHGLPNLNGTERTWSEFWTRDLLHASLPVKLEALLFHGVMWASAGYLTWLGVDSCQQYFYDVQHAEH